MAIYICRLNINSLLFYNTRKRQIFILLKWLNSVIPDSSLQDVFPEEECIEKVCRGRCRVYPNSFSIFCDSSGYELQVSYTMRTSKAGVQEAKALLSIMYKGEEGEEVLYARRVTHEDHEELAFMLKFLDLFTDMWFYEEHYLGELYSYEKRVIAAEKSYASLK